MKLIVYVCGMVASLRDSFPSHLLPTQRLRAGLTNCAPSGLAFRRCLEFSPKESAPEVSMPEAAGRVCVVHHIGGGGKMPEKQHESRIDFLPQANSFFMSSSSITGTPSSLALSSFEPASAPATT